MRNRHVRWVVGFLLAMLVGPHPARAGDYFAMIVNVSGSSQANARLDVSVDTVNGAGGVAVQYFLYRNDGTVVQFPLAVTNSNGFASNTMLPAPYNNLFSVSGGTTVLVEATTPGATSTNAVLSQTVKGQGRSVLGVPATFRANGTPLQGGTLIPIAVGDLLDATYLVIGNISNVPLTVNVFQGNTQDPALLRFTHNLAPRLVWVQQLQAADANSHLIVQALGGGNVVAQLAVVADGKLQMVTLLPLD